MKKQIVTELQSFGVRVTEDIRGRTAGAGPAEGRALLIDGTAVNVPIRAAYVRNSPYRLAMRDGIWRVFRGERELAVVDLVSEPAFYSLKTQTGVFHRKLALLHGKDCLATTVLQRCVHWKQNRRCAFCATELSLKNRTTVAEKRPGELAEAAAAAVKADGVTHMVLTSGTGDPPGSELPVLAECVRRVKAVTRLAVHVQFFPPEDISSMEILKTAGADTVGIHIESFDADILSKMAPAKAAVGLRRYEAAWIRAVEVFGANQVSSFIIAGLGERPESIGWGSELLADIGVYPFVVPLRPIPGSRLAHMRPPGSEKMERIYTAVAGILKRKGLSAGRFLAGCVRCGACSAQSLYEEPEAEFLCHRARTRQDRQSAFAIRRAVFVDEQKIFAETDVDENDAKGLQLVAKKHGETIGTVRIFPVNGNGDWIGGRLAVLPAHRTGKAGAALVREAMKRVKKYGCRKFTAHIQEENVPFFEKLKWRSIGEREIYLGRPHRLMQADLDQVSED